jgi:protein arginine kinase
MRESTNHFDFIPLRELNPLQRRVLVEKHLISPHLAEKSQFGSVFLNEQESISVMVNEEDHLRIQTLFPGFQLNEALRIANQIDDFIQDNIGIAYHEQLGFITSCPTNLGTGLRASVMMHLPGLVLTNQLNRIIPP